MIFALRSQRRDVSERTERIKWIQSKIDEIDKLSREGKLLRQEVAHNLM